LDVVRAALGAKASTDAINASVATARTFIMVVLSG
jgi:hypothetical protein